MFSRTPDDAIVQLFVQVLQIRVFLVHLKSLVLVEEDGCCGLVYVVSDVDADVNRSQA